MGSNTERVEFIENLNKTIGIEGFDYEDEKFKELLAIHKVSEYTSKDVIDSLKKTFETYWNDDEFQTFQPTDENNKKELKSLLSIK